MQDEPQQAPPQAGQHVNDVALAVTETFQDLIAFVSSHIPDEEQAATVRELVWG